MIEHPNAIPIAVVTAVCIFVLREVLEAIRRYKTNSRKLHAIRRLVAAECERNDFAIKKMLEHVEDIEEGLKHDYKISIEPTQRGVPRLAIKEPNEELASSSPIHPIQTANTEKYLFEVASLDKRLFGLMEKALDSLAEAKHVREGIIEYVSEDPFHLGGFVDHYAPRELNHSLDAVRDLYFNCTGEPLAKGRVR